MQLMLIKAYVVSNKSPKWLNGSRGKMFAGHHMNQREGFMDSKKNPPEKKNSLKIMEINP